MFSHKSMFPELYNILFMNNLDLNNEYYNILL